MTKIIAAISLSISLMLCSCTANNSFSVLICKKLSFYSPCEGEISVTAEYEGIDFDGTKRLVLRAKDSDTIINALSTKEAIYKSVESISLDDSLDTALKIKLVEALIGCDKMQQKCTVVLYSPAMPNGSAEKHQYNGIAAGYRALLKKRIAEEGRA